MTSQSIFLHSNDAIIDISSAEKVFYLDQSITAPPGYRLLIGLTNLTVPNAMFNVTSTSNEIVISGTPYTITPGNYTGDSLATAIGTALGSVGSVAFDGDNNNKFTFTFASAETIDSSTMERQLGLTGQLPTTAATTYAALNICDLGGVTNIYIRIRNLTMNNLDSRGKTSNIIASIVNNTNYGGYIFYVPPEVLYYQIVESNINHLDVEFTDQEGNIVDLNGASFNMTLTCHYVKQREAHRPKVLKTTPEETKTETEEKKNDSS